MDRENGMLDDMSEEELAAAQELQNSDAPIEQAPAEEPEPVEAAQDDTVQDQQDGSDNKPNPAADPARPDGYVPKEAVQEARRETKEMRQKYDALMEKLAEAATQKQAPEHHTQQEAAPDKDTDPVGYFEWKSGQLAKELNEIKETTGQITDQQRQSREHEQFVQSYTAAAQDFARGTPDFPDAYKHVVDNRDQYYQALGVADPVERQQMIANDEMFIAQRAMQEGVNPAERLYALAKSTGYAGPAAQQQDPNTRLQAQAQMQEANKSLSQVSGANGVKDTKNADDFRNMSEAQLWDFIAKNPGEAEKILAQVGT